MVSVLMIGATMSWFTATAGPVTNTFTTGTVNISADGKNGTLCTTNCDGTIELADYHLNPGDIKDLPLTINNTGSKSVYVRFKPVSQWGKWCQDWFSSKFVPLTNLNNSYVTFDVKNPNWVKGNDGYFYYKKSVSGKGIHKENGDVSEIEDPELQLTLNGANVGNEYENKVIQTKVTVDAIQSTNGAAKSQWGIDPTTIK